jgi:hypothetical protein
MAAHGLGRTSRVASGNRLNDLAVFGETVMIGRRPVGRLAVAAALAL